MATFKVGQRVRILRALLTPSATGKEGTVVRGVANDGEDGGPRYRVLLDDPALRSPMVDGAWKWAPWNLAPLTDPKADEFIETVKHWGPLHEEPKVVPVRETI